MEYPEDRPWLPAWRIFRQAEDGTLSVLFHSHPKGVRPGDSWYWADNKLVRDGSGESWYWSGFHVFQSRETAEGYLGNFRTKTGLVVWPVSVKYVATKPSNKDVLLAQLMRIEKQEERTKTNGIISRVH